MIQLCLLLNLAEVVTGSLRTIMSSFNTALNCGMNEKHTFTLLSHYNWGPSEELVNLRHW